MNYDVVIGLEVHAQLNTKSKAWCGCEISAHGLENQYVCEICSAQPGTLPVFNKEVVHFGSLLALATNCDINQVSLFDRKNYFYPDLPKGYQITQFHKPLAENGYLEINEGAKKIGIERIQIEEDTGKSTHSEKESLVNLNRCGTPLLEIVGRPDIRSAKEASDYLKKLHAILVYLGICDGNLQEGNFRADVNLSLRPEGSTKLGTRTEVKNLNSFSQVEEAISEEIRRQTEILNRGEKVVQQTLNFNPDTKKVVVLREKSDAHDYRYFPEPDLIPVVVTNEELAKWKKELPELPDHKKKRFQEEYSLPEYDSEVLTGDKDLADFFEVAAKAYKGEASKVSNWVRTEFLKHANEFGFSVSESPVTATSISELLNFVLEGEISGRAAKDVFERMFDEKKSPAQLIDEMGLKQISDEGAITKICQEVMNESPKQLEQYRAGKEKLFGFFVGQTIKKSQGKANPDVVNTVLKKILKG